MKPPRLPSGSHVYGPVPSRRLGSSLGVDLLPAHICPFDCVYCQLGRTAAKTLKRDTFFPIGQIMDQLKRKLDEGCAPDWITLAGSGEPTLYRGLGELVVAIKRTTRIPVLLLTNGALFTDPIVRAEAMLCDVVIPSLDAGDGKTFRRVNRPHQDLCFETVLEGLRLFRRIYYGDLWLEVMLVSGFNDSRDELAAIARSVRSIRPDRIQLNTPVRPIPGSQPLSLDPGRLVRIAKRDFEGIVDIVPFSTKLSIRKEMKRKVRDQEILDLVRRRPCTLEDLSNSLDVNRDEMVHCLHELTDRGFVRRQETGASVFYVGDAGRDDIVNKGAD